MKQKIEIESVKMVLQRQDNIDVKTVSKIIEELMIGQEEEDKVPPVKKQFVFMLSDPKGELERKDFVGWVLQIPEGDSPMAAEEKIVKSAYEFNITPKGRRMPLKTIAEVCEHVSGRITKEQGLWIKTKEPVYVIITNGKIPFKQMESN
jgi:hypothetical protein